MHQSLNLNPKKHFLRSRAITNLQAATFILLKLCLAIIILSSTGCGRSSSTENTGPIVISIDEKAFDNYYSFSQIIDTTTIEFIALETTTDIIGSVEKLIVTDDWLIIHDKATKSVWIFNTNGKFMSRINAQGRGPNEYMYLHTIIYKEPNLIGLLDEGLKIVWYNTNGEFIETEVIPYYASDIYFSDENRYVMYRSIPEDAPSSDKFYCHIIDEENNSSAQLWPYYQFGLFFGIFDPFFIANGSQVLIRNPFNTNLYAFENNELVERYAFDFSKPLFPYHSYKEEGSAGVLMKDYEDGNYRGDLRDISFTSSHLTLTYPDDHTVVNIVYDKDNGGLKVFSLNDLDDFGLFYKHPNTAHKDKFYSALYPYSLPGEFVDKLDIKGEVESANPVIMSFKYHDFLP